MIFHLVNVEMKETDAAASARTIFNFFTFQYRAALQHYAEVKGTYEGALAANQRSQDVYNDETKDELQGLGSGFGFHVPYSEATLAKFKSDVSIAQKDLDDAGRLLGFVRERFVEKFIQ